jgi:hypothetical protein
VEAGKEKLEKLKKDNETAPSGQTAPTTGTKPADTPGPLFGGK